jgi:hypothetical protein
VIKTQNLLIVMSDERNPAVSFAMHARLIPAFYIELVAQTRTVSAGEPLRELVKRLRTPLVEPGGAFAALAPTMQRQLLQ